MTFRELFGVDLPVIQAPMAGVQGVAMAAAVSNAGGLGSLPCAMLTPDALGAELRELRAATRRPFNVNFFCHQPPVLDPEREAAWRTQLEPYYEELGVDRRCPPRHLRSRWRPPRWRRSGPRRNAQGAPTSRRSGPDRTRQAAAVVRPAN